MNNFDIGPINVNVKMQKCIKQIQNYTLLQEIYKHREKEDFLQNQIATLQEQGKANEAKIQKMNEKQHALEREMDEKEKKGLERQIYWEKRSKYTSIAFFILHVIIFVMMVFYFLTKFILGDSANLSIYQIRIWGTFSLVFILIYKYLILSDLVSRCCD